MRYDKMTDASIDIEITSRGPVQYRGHWITYGIVGREWEMMCSSCGESISGNATRVFQLGTGKRPIFWMYVLSQFDVCDDPTDTWTEIISKKVTMNARGSPVTPDTERRISEDVSDLFVGPRPNVSLDTS